LPLALASGQFEYQEKGFSRIYKKEFLPALAKTFMLEHKETNQIKFG
jgi:hypothetical protein